MTESFGVTRGVRKVIAESDIDSGGWFVMWQDGRVEWFPTPASILRAVARTASADIDIATVEWRHPDPAWYPPEAK